jgi:hypothetical protein
MTTRTLVIGIPLPNASFDNASLLSASTFSEYPRMIIEPAAVSRVIDEVVQGAAAHQTYGGQAIVNGEGSSYAFGLGELLAMRRRETTRLLERGGLIICFAHPDAAHPDVIAEEPWRRYSWLPEDPSFSPREHLLPGFGRTGAAFTTEDHAFAPFVERLAKQINYRAHADEEAPAFKEQGRAFARSSGGSAVAFELPYAGGRLVFLPALYKPETIRTQVAEVLVEGLRAWDAEDAGERPPEWIRKEVT